MRQPNSIPHITCHLLTLTLFEAWKFPTSKYVKSHTVCKWVQMSPDRPKWGLPTEGQSYGGQFWVMFCLWQCFVWRRYREFYMFICVEWWPAGGYLYRQEGSDLSLAHTSSQPYISPWIKFPTEYSIQTFNSNFRSNPNISSVLPGLGMKGFIQSSWACTSLSLCHAVMPPCYNIHYCPPTLPIWGDTLPWVGMR